MRCRERVQRWPRIEPSRARAVKRCWASFVDAADRSTQPRRVRLSTYIAILRACICANSSPMGWSRECSSVAPRQVALECSTRLLNRLRPMSNVRPAMPSTAISLACSRINSPRTPTRPCGRGNAGQLPLKWNRCRGVRCPVVRRSKKLLISSTDWASIQSRVRRQIPTAFDSIGALSRTSPGRIVRSCAQFIWEC